MLNPPTIQIIPLISTPFTPISLPNVTINGALIFPKFEIAYDTPVPVDLIEVGKDYVVIKENNANANVLNNLLIPIRAI
jgi:hypothetical protein